MPYRIPFQPKQRPAWDACRCRWTFSIVAQFTNGLYYELPMPLFESNEQTWFCCRCNVGNGLYCSISAKHKFCPVCGHARDLRVDEQEDNWMKMFPNTTQSSGPR